MKGTAFRARAPQHAVSNYPRVHKKQIISVCRATQQATLPLYRHLIIPPSGNNDGNDCLLAVSPGAFLAPEAFTALAAEVQASAPQLRLWCGVLNVDIPSLSAHFAADSGDLLATLNAMDASGAYAELLRQLVDQATAAGFAPQRDSPTRISNMVLLCQSVGSFGFAPLSAKAAGATILLATSPNGHEQYASYQTVSLEAWPRPVMMLAGELDGQMRWPWLSSYVAESASLAAKFGPGYAATHRPVVVVPDINHGNTSNGEARVARGDIVRGVLDYNESVKVLGSHVAAFLLAHFAGADDARSQANEFLLQSLLRSMALTAPYCVALGLGNPCASFAGSQADQSTSPPAPVRASGGPFLPGGLIGGAQRMPGSMKSSALHPGVVVAAEDWAAELQRRVVSGLPAEALERLTIAATAHTDLETLLYSQPEMVPLAAGKWLLRVHVLIHIRALDGAAVNGIRHLTPRAPDYTLKLKDAAFVAAALGLPSPSQYGTPKPAELNALALERALAGVPAAVLERYRQLGRQMEFGDDWNTFTTGPDGKTPTPPEGLVRDARISFKHLPGPADTAAPGNSPAGPPPPESATLRAPYGSVRVSSPYFVTPPSDDVGRMSKRFAGSYYAKVMSVAQAMEWVWLDCLRSIATPW